MAEANQKQFEPVKIEEARSLLKAAVPYKARLQCWTAGQQFQFISRIINVIESGNINFISVTKEEGGTKFEKDVLGAGISEVIFSLALPTDTLFFKGEIRKGETGFMNFKVEKVFKVQRRTAMRLPLTADKASVCTLHMIDGSVFFGAPLNISDGGVGLLIDEKFDFDQINKVKKIARLEMSIGSIQVEAEAEVRHGQEVSSTMTKKTYKIGVQFTQIDQKLQDRIRSYVFEESAKFIGRY